MTFSGRIAVFSLVAGAAAPAQAAGPRIVIPQIPGHDVRARETVSIPGAESAIVHAFDDGRIVLMAKEHGVWSRDGGRTWQAGPRGPDDKTVINLLRS